jgi:low temperature requirement protein LtrA
VSEREQERGDEHLVTPLELFFDLVFVFAITQVTSLLADDPTWGVVFRGMLVLAALWWALSVYAWLTSAMGVDEGGVRLVMLASMGAELDLEGGRAPGTQAAPTSNPPNTSNESSTTSTVLYWVE